MKKIVLFGALGILALASCKKNHVCECLYNDGEKYTSNLVNMKKKDAKNICEAKSHSDAICKLQ